MFLCKGVDIKEAIYYTPSAVYSGVESQKLVRPDAEREREIAARCGPKKLKPACNTFLNEFVCMASFILFAFLLSRYAARIAVACRRKFESMRGCTIIGSDFRAGIFSYTERARSIAIKFEDLSRETGCGFEFI